MSLLATLKQKRASLLAKLKRGRRGVFSSVAPTPGTRLASVEEVKRRLLALSGKGIETRGNADGVVVAWAAKVSSSGPGGADYQYLYRALKVELNPEHTSAAGICLKTDSNVELDLDSFGLSKSWFRGQEIGFEQLYVVAWLGAHRTEGGADVGGCQFSWSQIREPVINTVISAGWTYRPQRA